MRGGVVGLGDEKLRLSAWINGREHVTDLCRIIFKMFEFGTTDSVLIW